MKKYYIDGGILITTPFFKYVGGGAGFGMGSVPDCEVIPTTNTLPTGEDYLLIDDEHPQSMFAEYYAKSFFTTGYCWAPLFHKTYNDDYSEFKDRLNDARQLMRLADQNDCSETSALLSRQSFLTVLSALDTFIADTVLTRITNDEDIFYQFLRRTNNYSGCEEDIGLDKKGVAEQKVLDYVLRHSYLNPDSIKETYKTLFSFSIVVQNEMKELFHQRHLIAHRGGRKKDGSFIKYSSNEIEDTIRKTESFAQDILMKILKWEKS